MRRASWTAGEFVHRDLADKLAHHRDTTESGMTEMTESGTVEATREREIRPISSETVQLSEAVGRPESFHPVPMETADNPILTAGDVTDYGNADFVADPFLFAAESEELHLFFEVFNHDRRPTAVISHAVSGNGGRTWEYDRIVLRDEVHLAFPYVFKWEDAYYMVPDRWNRQSTAAIRLYRTEALPDGWRPVSTIIRPTYQLTDCVVFRWNDRWWAIAGRSERDDLHVFHADELRSNDWTPHERNPVVTGRPRGSRPAGRPIVGDDGLLLFLQDCTERYGEKVRAFDVEELSSTTYADRERSDSPVLEESDRRIGWNSGCMHHIDPRYTSRGWLCAVDGNIGFGHRVFNNYHWAIGMYRA